jgi:hypothetical protein
LIDEYSTDAMDEGRYDDFEGVPREETTEDWKRYAQFAIGRMLFKIITRMEQKAAADTVEPLQDEFDLDEDWDLLELARFVANHSYLGMHMRGPPDLREILYPEDVSPIMKYQIRDSLWENLVDAVANEIKVALVVG